MTRALVKTSSLDAYLREVNSIPVLSRKEEHELAVRYYKHGDIEAAHKLVLSNLRFVVKIAMEYRGYGMKLKDLIQEGNMGLMMAVKKFNPYKGYRLITYAVWWIRAYIQKFILETWSLVKIGTTQAQRKLFRAMSRTWNRLRQLEGKDPTDEQLAKTLSVREQDVVEMKKRLAARDASLDAGLDDDGGGRTPLELMPASEVTQEDIVEREEAANLLKKAVEQVRPTLNEKEKVILEKRLLADEPLTLEEIGSKFSISRERVRQLEERIKKKLKGLLLEQGYSFC